MTGRTIEAELDELDLPQDEEIDADVRYLVEEPIHDEGEIKILTGNIAPGGAVLKVTADDNFHHEGPARVFETEEAAMKYVQDGHIESGDVIIIRNEGPRADLGCGRCSVSLPPWSVPATKMTSRC